MIHLFAGFGLAAAAAVLAFAPLSAADGDAPAEGPTAEEMAMVRAHMGPPITEEKYAALLKLQTAVQNLDSKIQGAKDDAAKAEFQKAREQAFTDAKITAADYQKMIQQLQQIKMMLNMGAMKDDPKTAAAMQQALAMFDPVSVATVKAHLSDGAANPATGDKPAPTGDPAAAAKPARTGPLPAESDADPAQFTGTWLFDMDTTLEAIQPGLPAEQKQMVLGMLKGQVHISRVVFGADKKATAVKSNPDGTETKETGTWSYADKKVTIKKDDKTQKDEVMDVAMRGEFLMLGQGKNKAAFQKKPN